MKKTGMFLLVIALCSGMAVVYSTTSGTGESTNTKSLLLDNSDSVYSTQPNFATGSDVNPDAGELFFKMILMVLLVVVFGAVAIYLSKKLLPKLTCLPGKRIQVCETVHLGPRKMIHLIKIDEQMLLVGSTNENITKLADITGRSSEVDLPANPIDNN